MNHRSKPRSSRSPGPALLCGALLTLLGLSALAAGDEVVLKNGRSIYGEVVRKTSKEVVVRLESGELLKLPAGMVQEIVKSEATPSPTPAPTPSETPGPAEPAPDLASATLEWRLAKGQTLRYEHQVEFRVLDGKEERVREHSTWFSLEGVAASSDGFVVELTISRMMRRTLSGLRQLTREDSGDADPAQRPPGSDLIGVPLSFQVHTNGQARLIAYGRQPLPKEREQVFQESLLDGIYRFMGQGFLGQLPPGPVRVAEPSWKSELSLNSFGTLKFSVVNQVAKIEAERIHVRQEGSAKLEVTPSSEGGVQVEFGVGALKGLTRFHRSGILEESRVKVAFRAKQPNKANGESATLNLILSTTRLE